MSEISDTTNKTAVKIFSKLLIGALAFVSLSSFAQDKKNEAKEIDKYTICDDAEKRKEEGYKTRTECVNAFDGTRTREESVLCKQASDKIDEATRKIGESCRKAGLSGSKNCVSKSLSCAEEAEDEDESFDTVSIINALAGVQGDNSRTNSKCPQMSGRDYFTEKDKIQKDIKETEKELAELNDDKADIQDKYHKEMQKIEETLTKANEEYEEKLAALDQETRERLSEFNRNQADAKEKMAKKGDEILGLRGSLVKLQRDKARSLNAFTESAGKRKCVSDLVKMREEYTKLHAGSSTASSNHIAQQKRKKQEMIDFYNTCMNDFNQQRIALQEGTRQKQEEIEKQLRDAQSSLDEAQNSLNLASSQLTEINQAGEKKKAAALKSVQDLATRSNQQMQAAYTKLQENLKSLQAKTSSLSNALTRANQSLGTLGPVPKNRASDYSPGDASSDIDSQISVISRASYGLPDRCKKDIDNATKSALKKYGVQ